MSKLFFFWFGSGLVVGIWVSLFLTTHFKKACDCVPRSSDADTVSRRVNGACDSDPITPSWLTNGMSSEWIPAVPAPQCSYLRRPPAFFGAATVEYYKHWGGIPHIMQYQYSLGGQVIVDHRRHLPYRGAPASVDRVDPANKTKIGFWQVYKPAHNILKIRNGRIPIWSKEVVDVFLNHLSEGKDISCHDYPKSAGDVALALRLIGGVVNRDVFVHGSISPWVEAICLHAGAQRVATVDWQTPDIDPATGIEPLLVPDLLRTCQPKRQFDVLISYSSVEHDGLGRYDDPLDPFGDFRSMRELYALTRPGGYLLLAVPTNWRDLMLFPHGRLYGPVRLPLLAHGAPFEFVGAVRNGTILDHVPLWSPDIYVAKMGLPNWSFQPIIVLHKLPEQNGQSTTSSCRLVCDKDAPGVRPVCRQPDSLHPCTSMDLKAKAEKFNVTFERYQPSPDYKPFEPLPPFMTGAIFSKTNEETK